MRRLVTVVLCIVICMVTVFVGYWVYREFKVKFMFEDIASQDVKEVLIVREEDKTYLLTLEEAETVLCYIGDISVYQKVSSKDAPDYRLKVVFKDEKRPQQDIGWEGDRLCVDGVCYRIDPIQVVALEEYCEEIANEYEDYSAKRLFEWLKAEDVESVTEIHYSDSRVLNSAEMEYFVDRLSNVIFYQRKDMRLGVYGGEYIPHFLLKLKNGYAIKIRASGIYVWVGEEEINGKRYSSEFSSTEALTKKYCEYWRSVQ